MKNIKKCKFKAYLSQFVDFKTLNNKSNMINKIYKDIIKDYDFLKLSEEELNTIILEKTEDKYFLTKQEKEVETNIILKHFLRYFKYEKSRNREIIFKNIYGTITLDNHEIEVNADIVFNNGNNLELVKYKTGATELSYKARTDKNLPENDIELYLLKKLGEKLYPNKPIMSSFYHLKGKKDSKDIYNQFLENKTILECNIKDLEGNVFIDKKAQKENDKNIKEIKDVLYFESSLGNNIITFDYNKSLDTPILELLNSKISFNSEKCKSSDCEFCNYSTLCNHEYKDNKDGIELVKDLKKSSGELKLTDAQKQVIDIEFGNHRINAVAGSGKSTAMVMRTIELFKKGYKPDEELLITFTNKGCQELKEKINYWLNYYKIKNIDTRDLNIFTFNSFGENIISKEWEPLGFTEKPKLANSIDVNDIIKELLEIEKYSKLEWLNYRNPLLNYPNAKGAFKQLLICFNLIKSYSYDTETFIEKALKKEKDFDLDRAKEKSEIIFELYAMFNKKLKSKNLLQYQDQILYVIELFKKNKDLTNKYGYKHLIVDEYQDTDFTQVKLLHLLEKYKQLASLMVVGDSSQAIYGFRNTTPENILNFDKEFKDVQDTFLLDNFRSTPEICNVANKLDKLNTARMDKEIIGKKDSGKLPSLITYKTLEDEYADITDLIKEKIAEGIPKHEICVIARTKKELLEIQSYLNKEDIHNIIEASELCIDNTNIQHIINLGNFFKNNEQDYYLMEHSYIKDEAFSEVEFSDIKVQTEELKNKIITDFAELETEESKIEYFYNLIIPIIEKDEVAKSFVEGLQNKIFFTFNQFLDYLYKVILYKDDTSVEKDENKYDAVVLTTAHSSKGKEWSIVISTINSFKYEDIKDNLPLLEEERRLLFVDITRAKDELYITYNTNENKTRNKGKYVLFADELEDIEKISM